MERYRHRALDRTARQIRLVRIDKECDQGNPIHLTLRFAYLDAGEKYNALSYAWGDPPADQEIIVTDDSTSGTFLVRKNLYDYLMTAHTSTDEWSEGWIWIDQICIDQDNHEERCHQVHQMADLYSRTQTTVVWPGLTTHTIQKEITDPFNPVFSPEEVESIRHTPYDMRYIHDGKLVGPSIPSESSMRLIGRMTNLFVAELSSSRYWDRLWIIQEICLAPRVRVIMRDEAWMLEDVVIAFSILRTFYKNTAVAKSYMPVSMPHLSHFVVRIHSFMLNRDIQQRGEGRNVGGDWGMLLMTGAMTKCTEPLDRVYGLMGLIREDLRIYPDYTLSHHDILRRVLEKVLMCSITPRELLWSVLQNTIHAWWYGSDFERVSPAGRIDDPDEDGKVVPLLILIFIKTYNARLVLQELRLPVPTEPPLTPKARETWIWGNKVLAVARSRNYEVDQVVLEQQGNSDLKDIEHHIEMARLQQAFLEDVEQAWTEAIHHDDRGCAVESRVSDPQAAIRSKVEEVIMWFNSEAVQAEGSWVY